MVEPRKICKGANITVGDDYDSKLLRSERPTTDGFARVAENVFNRLNSNSWNLRTSQFRKNYAQIIWKEGGYHD